jgi:hypothetical protein
MRKMGLRGKERVEQLRQIVGRDATAGIAHGDFDAGVRVARAQYDPAFLSSFGSIASMALTTRFRITCCRDTRSAAIAGRAGTALRGS